MAYELMMVASRNTKDLLSFRKLALEHKLPKLTDLIERANGWVGIGALHVPSGQNPWPFLKFISEHDAMAFNTRRMEWSSNRIPGKLRLQKILIEWLDDLPEANDITGKSPSLTPLNDALDAAMAEAAAEIFSAEIVAHRKELVETILDQTGVLVKQTDQPEAEKPAALPKKVDETQKYLDQADQRLPVEGSLKVDDFLPELSRLTRRLGPAFKCDYGEAGWKLLSEHTHNGFLKILDDPIREANTPARRQDIFNFMKQLEFAIRCAHESQKILLFKMIADIDPSLAFPFCREEPLPHSRVCEFFEGMFRTLQDWVPNRVDLTWRLTGCLTRHLLGDQSVLSPLLYGPPGTGKSVLGTALADALRANGMPAKTLFQPLSGEMSRHYNDSDMNLFGISMHWGNGAPGRIFETVHTSRVCQGLIVLDEADKTPHANHLVGLLDPKMPLQDKFIRDCFDGFDLRPKTFFILTANDPTALLRGEDDPLCSRLEFCFVPPYSREEMLDLVVTLVMKESAAFYDLNAGKVRSIARPLLEEPKYANSFRDLVNAVNGQLFLTTFPGLDDLRSKTRIPGHQRPKVIPMRRV